MSEAGPGTEPATPASSRASNVLVIVGWITAILIPLPVGIAIGAILASQDDKRGRYILGTSIAIMIIWLLFIVIVLQTAEDQARHDYYYE